MLEFDDVPERYDPRPDPEYDAYMEHLAFHAECTYTSCVHGEGKNCPEYHEMECFDCSDFREPYLKRQVIRLGPVVNRADPTQTYVLSCGHYTI